MTTKAIFQSFALTSSGDIIPSVEYTVIDEGTGLPITIYSDRAGTTEKTAPYFATVSGLIEFYIDAGTTYRVNVLGPTGSFASRYNQGLLLGELASKDELQDRIQGLDSIADLSGLVGAFEGQQVSVKGYHAGSDVGGGMFYWDSSRTGENNGGTVFNGWVRILDGYVTPEMFGAVSGTQSNAQLLAMFAIGRDVDLGEGNVWISSVRQDSLGRLFGRSELRFTGTGLLIAFGQIDDGVNITAEQGNPVITAKTDLKVFGRVYSDDAAVGLNMNAPNISRVTVLGGDITAENFAILENENQTGGDLIVSSSRVAGVVGDAIELNHPGNIGTANAVLSSNILSAGETPGTIGGNAGFSIGLAAVHNTVSVGNLSKRSRNEGYHLEDSSYGVVTVGNLFAGCLGGGAVMGGTFAGESDEAKGGVHVGNSFIKERDPVILSEADTGWRQGVGFLQQFDTNKTIHGYSTAGNYVEGFDVGYELSKQQYQVLSGNVSYDCNTAVQIISQGIAVGDHLAWDCDVGFTGEASIGPKIVTNNEAITHVKRRSSSSAGSATRGFSGSGTITTIAGDFVNVRVCKLSGTERARGSLLGIAKFGGSDGSFAEWSFTWDGTTLTQTKLLTKDSGTIGLGALVVSGGDLYIRLFSVTGSRTVKTVFDFDGVYYSESL